MKLTAKQKDKIAKIGGKHRLDFIVLHGSQATGKVVTVKPDIDIAIYRRGGIDFDELVDLTNEFMKIFGNQVDVKTLHRKDPLFRFEVMRDSILLYGDRKKYSDFFLYAYKDYQESRSLYRLLPAIQKKRQQVLNKLYA